MMTKSERRDERRQTINGAAYGQSLVPGRMAPADTIPVSPELADALSEAAQILDTYETCADCHIKYPAPVGYHHSEEECLANNGVVLDERVPIGHAYVGNWGAKPDPDLVNNPPHYTQQPSGIEPIEITKHLNFCLGNVVKYVLRADFKGSAVQDLRKARRYLDIEIEMREQAAV